MATKGSRRPRWRISPEAAAEFEAARTSSGSKPAPAPEDLGDGPPGRPGKDVVLKTKREPTVAGRLALLPLCRHSQLSQKPNPRLCGGSIMVWDNAKRRFKVRAAVGALFSRVGGGDRW